jgi:hypothetical protein
MSTYVYPDAPADPEAAALDLVVDPSQLPRCEMAGGCKRPARWRLNLHGCEQVNMCGQHKAAWLRDALAQDGKPRCFHCGVVFDSVDDAVTVTAI